MPNFTLKTTPVSKSDNPSHWKYTQFEIFQDGVKIGEFERNYPHHAEGSFKPFKIDGQWYATYSSKYNKLSIMTLPDCKHWCDVEHTPDGVCPTEVILNRFINVKYRIDKNKWFADKFKNGVCTENYWWLNDEKTDSKVLTETINCHEFKELLEESEEHITFTENNIEKIRDIILKYQKNVGHIDVDIDEELTYSNKIVFEGCYWGGPYDLWWIDISNISQMKGKQIPINFLADEIRTNFPLSLEDRVKFEDEYFIVFVEKIVEFNKQDEVKNV